MTGAILTKFGRAPTTWTTLPDGMRRAPKQIDLACGSAGREQFRHAQDGPAGAPEPLLRCCQPSGGSGLPGAAEPDVSWPAHAAPAPPCMTLSRAGASTPRSCSASRRRAPTSAAPTRSTACGGIGRRRSSVGAGAGRRSCRLHARSPVDVRRLYRRRHPVIAKALGVFASVEARAQRLTQDAGPRAVELRAAELLDADRSAGAARMGLPVGRADALELLSGGQPQRRRRPRSRRAACSRAAPLTGRSDLVDRAPRRGALGPRRALGRAGGLLRLSRRPPREHPQREHARRLAGRRGRGRRAASPASASPAPCGARWTRSAATGRGPTARARSLAWVGLLPHGLRAAVPGSPARRGRPRRRGGRAGRRRTTARSSTRRVARACGRTSAFPRTRIRRARG